MTGKGKTTAAERPQQNNRSDAVSASAVAGLALARGAVVPRGAAVQAERRTSSSSGVRGEDLIDVAMSRQVRAEAGHVTFQMLFDVLLEHQPERVLLRVHGGHRKLCKGARKPRKLHVHELLSHRGGAPTRVRQNLEERRHHSFWETTAHHGRTRPP